MECIRRYYNGQTSPLYDTIKADCKFYDLFVDFKGYVDFFFLQDAVTDDYSKVIIWCGDGSFTKSGLLKAIEEYFVFIEREFDFLNKWNNRIKNYCDMSIEEMERLI